MNHMNHTPSPWKSANNSVLTMDGLHGIAILEPMLEFWSHDATGINPINDPDAMIANANLIAAAPELLRACEMAYHSALAHGNSSAVCIRLAKAIAKAKGEKL